MLLVCGDVVAGDYSNLNIHLFLFATLLPVLDPQILRLQLIPPLPATTTKELPQNIHLQTLTLRIQRHNLRPDLQHRQRIIVGAVEAGSTRIHAYPGLHGVRGEGAGRRGYQGGDFALRQGDTLPAVRRFA